jgi:hypothetical protein
MENQPAGNQIHAGKSSPHLGNRNDHWKSIASGIGFFIMGFIGLLVSVWLTGNVKAIVGIATIFGAGLVGHGVFKVIFHDRFPTVCWIVAVSAALVGLLLTCAGLFIILGDDFM